MIRKNSEKDLEKDERFVIEAHATYTVRRDLQYALGDYFNKKYKKEILITFDDAKKAWHVSTPKGEKTINYIQAIPKAVHELL